MGTKSVLILVPYETDQKELIKTVETLRAFRIGYSIRFVSPERAPHLLDVIMEDAVDIAVVFCWAQETSFLVNYVNARIDLPVLSLGLGGVDRSLLQVMRVLGNERAELREELRRERLSQAMRVAAVDREQADIFTSGEL